MARRCRMMLASAPPDGGVRTRGAGADCGERRIERDVRFVGVRGMDRCRPSLRRPAAIHRMVVPWRLWMLSRRSLSHAATRSRAAAQPAECGQGRPSAPAVLGRVRLRQLRPTVLNGRQPAQKSGADVDPISRPLTRCSSFAPLCQPMLTGHDHLKIDCERRQDRH
jgi:hypothetical protein